MSGDRTVPCARQERLQHLLLQALKHVSAIKASKILWKHRSCSRDQKNTCWCIQTHIQESFAFCLFLPITFSQCIIFLFKKKNQQSKTSLKPRQRIHCYTIFQLFLINIQTLCYIALTCLCNHSSEALAFS